MKSNRRPAICATSIAAFLAASIVSPGVTYDVPLGDSLTVSSAVPDFVTKNGGGTLVLTGVQTYSGATAVNEGALVISSIGNLGATSSVSINHLPAVGTTGTTGVTQGVSAGQLVIAGGQAPQVFNFTPFGGLNVSGGGFGGNGVALNSVGNNSVGGAVALSGTSATRIGSSFGVLNISSLALGSTGTTGQTLTLQGNGHFALSGITATAGATIVKAGSGTLILSGSNTNSGIVQVDAGSIRGTTGANFGTSTATNAINFNNAAVEIRTDNGSGFANKGLSIATNNGTLNVDRLTSAPVINQTVTFAGITIAANRVLTVNGRNGYGVTFAANAAAGAFAANQTFTNNSSGTLAFAGNVWNNTDTTGSRSITFAATGDIEVGGNILATAGTVAQNHIAVKTGAGTLTVLGTASTFTGTTDIQNGTWVARDFGSIGSSTSAGNINLGNAATTGTLTFTGAPGTGAVGSTARGLVLNGTSGGGRINASQSGSAPTAAVFAGAFTAPGTATNTKTLTLGGSSLLDNEITGVIPNSSAGGVALLKADAGTWVLSGSNTYTGGTTITNGTLKLKANAGGVSTVLSNDGAVTFNADATTQAAGGSLVLVGTGVATTEAIGAITTTAGHGVVRVQNAGAATTLATSLTASSAGNSVNFQAPTANDIITVTNAPGFLRATAYFNGANYAFVGASNTLRAPLYGDGLGGAGTDVGFVTSAAALTPALHNQITGAGFTVAAGTTAVNSLLIDGAGTPTLTLGATDQLQINTGANTAGGILLANGSATITGGSITEGLGTNGGAIAVRVDGGANVLTLVSPIAATTSLGLSKNGAGTLVLAGNNQQAGTTAINEGTVRLAPGGRLSAANGALQLRQGAILDLNGVNSGTAISSINGAGTVTNGGTVAAVLTVGNNNGGGTFTGLIQNGASPISVIKQGTAGMTLPGANTYSGATTINSTGILSVTKLANIGQPSGIGTGDATNAATNSASLVFGGASTTNAQGGLGYTGADSVAIDRLFTLASNNSTGGAGARIQASGANNATLIFSNPAPIAYTAAASTVAQTLALDGTSTGDNQMGLQLVNPGAGSSVLNVAKTGTGTWVLGNSANNYTGRTTITAGRLIAEGATLPSGSPLVLGGGVLETSGSFTRPLTATPTNGTGEVNFTGAGGFAASKSKLTVNLGGAGAALTWNGGTGFLPNTGVGGTVSSALILSSVTALDEVEFQNEIALNNAASTLARTIQVDDNTTTTLDRATITGPITGDGGIGAGLNKTGGASLYLLGNNTYTGSTTLAAGVIGVTSVNSGLGAAATPLNLNAGRLEYVGGTEASSRVINLNASATVDTSGSGALVLSGLVTGTGTAARTLTLQGLNTDGNEISSIIANPSGSSALTSVTKGGGGTWVLSGANTFGGAVTAGGGNLGFTQTAAAGTGTLTLGNGNLFADGGDVTLTNPTVGLAQNATGGVVGVNSLTLTGAVNVGTGGNTALNNFLPAGKSFTLTGNVTNADSTANRSFTHGGTGRTVMSGVLADNTVVATATRNLVVTINSGTLVLGGATANTYSGATTINGGILQLAGSGNTAIPDGVGKGNVVFANTVLPASLLLGGLSETINGLTGTSTGVKSIDNNSGSAATLTVGAADGPVNFNGNIGNSGGGALSIVKTGTAAGIFSGSSIGYSGTTTVQATGSLAFPTADPAATTGVTVEGNAGLSFINGTGTPMASLTTLNLGGGAGTTVLGLDVGGSTDTLTTTGAATTANTVNFAINAVSGFAPAGGTYDLLVSAAGGFGGASYGLSSIPGGFTYSINTSDPNKVRLVATPTGALRQYNWTGDLNSSWSAVSAGNTNWEVLGVDPGNATPGANDVVNFSSTITPPSSAAGNIVSTTLDGNRTIDNLKFNGSINAGGGTVGTNVLIAQGTGGVLTIKPLFPTDGIVIPDNGAGAGYVASITAPVQLGSDQTWSVGSLGSPAPLLTVTGVMSGTGSLTKDGFGTVTLTGNNTRQSTTTILAGVLNINAEAALGANPAAPDAGHLTIDGGSLRATAALVIDDPNRGIELGSNNGTFDGSAAASNITIAATNVISGAGSLIKAGANTLILNGANTYSGGSTTVNAGIIRVGNAAALNTSVVTLNGTGATLEVADGISVSNAITISDVTNGKVLRLLAGATSGTISGPITVAETGGGFFGAQANAPGTLNITGNILQSGTAAPGLRVNELAANTGTVVLSGANTYGGTTEVRGGTLRNGANDVIPGALTVNAVTAAAPTATYNLGGNNETISGALTFGAAASSTAAYVNTITTGAGTLTLGGNVTTIAGNAGTQAVINGNLNLGTSTGARTITVADAANQGSDLLVSGVITGATTGLTKAGPGTLEIAVGAVGTFAGTTTVSAGRLLVNGSISGAVAVAGGILGGNGSVLAVTANSGSVSPGNGIGTLSATSLTMNTGSSFTLEINSSTLTTDILNTGAFSLSGTVALNISDLNLPGTAVPLGTEFTFINYSSWNAGLFTVAGNLISDNNQTFLVGPNLFQIDYNDNGGTSVSLVAVPEPGIAASLLGGFGMLVGLQRIRRRNDKRA